MGLLQLERHAVAAEKEMNTLAAALDEHGARRARLAAELGQDQAIVFPPELTSRDGTPSVARIMRLEKVQFEAGRSLFEASLEAQRKQVRFFERELQSIQSRTASLTKEQAAIERQQAALQSLYARARRVRPNPRARARSRRSPGSSATWTCRPCGPSRNGRGSTRRSPGLSISVAEASRDIEGQQSADVMAGAARFIRSVLPACKFALFVMVAISYFDLRRVLLAVSASFLALNGGLTLVTLRLDPGLHGYGYFPASLLSAALAYTLAARAFARLPYMTFVANNRGLA